MSSTSHANSFAADSGSASHSLVGITSRSSHADERPSGLGVDSEKNGYMGEVTKRTLTKMRWYGKKYTVEVTEIDWVDVESLVLRPALLYAPVYKGLAMGLAMSVYLFLSLEVYRWCEDTDVVSRFLKCPLRTVSRRCWLSLGKITDSFVSHRLR